MYQQKLIIEIKGDEERMYQFMLPPDAPLGELHNAANALKDLFLKQIEEYESKEEASEEGKTEEKSEVS